MEPINAVTLLRYLLPNMRKYLAEFIGAFFLVLTVGLTGLPEPYAGVIAPLAIGACSW